MHLKYRLGFREGVNENDRVEALVEDVLSPDPSHRLFAGPCPHVPSRQRPRGGRPLLRLAQTTTLALLPSP
jgi:hypothetical protein